MAAREGIETPIASSGRSTYYAIIVASIGLVPVLVNHASHSPEEPSVSPDSVEIQTHIDQVWDSFNGSRFERDAASVLQAHSLNQAMDTCMSEAGFPEWDWSMPRPKNPESHGLESSTFFAAPLAAEYTTALRTSADAVKAEAKARHVTIPPDEDRAIGACLAKVPPASDDETSATPPAAQRLRDQWWAMVSRLDSECGDDAAYASCLGASDIEGLGKIGSRDDATLAMQEMTPAASQLPTDADSAWVDSPQWQSLLTAEPCASG